MTKRYKLIDKSDIMPCWKCSGIGFIPYKNEAGEELHFIKEKDICDVCNGSGKWVETHYIIIDEKNKIAIDSDTGG